VVVGIGSDVLDVARMRAELARDATLAAELFTAGEIDYCSSQRYPERHFAARFAAKEALFKALRLRFDAAPPWREVEVVRAPGGEPGLILHGKVLALAAERHVARAFVSLTHTTDVALASVLLES
jgi:holo-[acyl-carrier protein] synthase